jgi:hypothetical protein
MRCLSAVQSPLREKSSVNNNNLNHDASALLRYNGSASETGELTVIPPEEAAECKRRGFIFEDEAGDEEEKEMHRGKRMPLKSLGNTIDAGQVYSERVVTKKNTPTKQNNGNASSATEQPCSSEISSSSSSTSFENGQRELEPISSTDYSKLSIGISKPTYETPSEYGMNPLLSIGIMNNFLSSKNTEEEDSLSSWELSPRSWDSSPRSLDEINKSIGGMLSHALWVIKEVDEDSTGSEVSRLITSEETAGECSHTDELDWEDVEQARLQRALGPLLGTTSYNQESVNYYEDKLWEEEEHLECPPIVTNCFLGALSTIFVDKRKQDCLVVAVEDSHI